MIDQTGMSDAELVVAAQQAWIAGDYNLAADYVSALRGIVGARGGSVEQTGDGMVIVTENVA